MKCHLHPDRDAVGYCVACGQGVCAECRREVAGAIRCPNHTAAVLPVAPPATKSGFLAGLFSMMFPGLGHLYAGAYQRGLRFGGLAVALIVILSIGHEHLAVLFGMSLFFTWAYAIFDAVRISHEINRGAYVEAAGGVPTPVRRSGTGTLTFGIVLLGIGTLFLADRYIELDRFFDFVENNIGFIFVALGVILVAAYARRRNRERDAAIAVAPPSEPVADSSTSPNRSFLK